MLQTDKYEYWLDVVITGNAVETERIAFCDTDGYGDADLLEHLDTHYPGYKFSHNSVDGNNVYTDGKNVLFISITANSEFLG